MLFAEIKNTNNSKTYCITDKLNKAISMRALKSGTNRHLFQNSLQLPFTRSKPSQLTAISRQSLAPSDSVGFVIKQKLCCSIFREQPFDFYRGMEGTLDLAFFLQHFGS